MIFTEISSRMLWRRRLQESWWRRPWPRCLEERWGGPAGGRSGGQSPRHSRPRCRCWRSPPWCSVEWLLLYNMDWTTWQGRGWRRRLHLIDGQCWLLDQSRRERSHHNIEAFTLTKSQGILVSARMTVQSNSRLPAQLIGLKVSGCSSEITWVWIVPWPYGGSKIPAINCFCYYCYCYLLLFWIDSYYFSNIWKQGSCWVLKPISTGIEMIGLEIFWQLGNTF